MSVYKYNQSKVIDEITFKKTAKGAVRAYLHARPEVGVEELNHAIKILKDAGFECIPFTLDGKPTLEVRGFKRETQFLSLLNDNKLVNGNAEIVKQPEDIIDWRDKLKERSLQLSGLFYVVGDYNFFTYGRREAHPEDMLAGLMYAGGTTALVGFGRNDQSDRQVRDLSKKIMHHLAEAGVKLPEDHALHHLVTTKKKNLFENVHDTFERYPSEMFNLFTGLAGACITASALKYKVLKTPAAHMDLHAIKAMRTEGWLDVGLGTLTMASTAIGGLVDEKAHDPDAPQSHVVQAVLDWVRERPLTVAAAGLLVSTGCHAVSTYKAYDEAKRIGDMGRLGAIVNRATFVATNLAAELLISISSKGHGEGVVSDKSVDISAIAVAAELIAKQPEDVRESLIDYMGKFLGQPKLLAMDDQEVIKLLRHQVEAMCSNPWAKVNGVVDTASVVLCPPASVKTATKSWQAKTIPLQDAEARPSV